MNGDNKIILDLCGGTGSWSNPYKDNGYDVRLITFPEHDVRTYEPPENVYGIWPLHLALCFQMRGLTQKLQEI